MAREAAGPAEETEPIVVGADGVAMMALSCGLILLSGGLSLLAALAFVLWHARRAPAVSRPGSSAHPSRVLVLGMRLSAAGDIPAEYRERLDRALQISRQGRANRIVILGGAGRAGVPAEAVAGRAYLTACGLPADHILLEDRSRHTLDNLRRYRERFDEAAGGAVLVTSRFHLARATVLARGLGIAHHPCAAEERWRPQREAGRLLREAFLIHWYVTGRGFARLTGNRRIAARIS